MPKVHHVKAAKNYPDAGIKKGEMYYWWKFRYGGKHRSKVQPRTSQITGSEKISRCFAAEENIEDAFKFFRTALEKGGEDANVAFDDLISALSEGVDELEDVSSEYQDAADNMTIEGTPKENCEEAAQEIESQKDELELLKDKVESHTESFGARDAIYDWKELAKEWKSEFQGITFGPSVF